MNNIKKAFCIENNPGLPYSQFSSPILYILVEVEGTFFRMSNLTVLQIKKGDQKKSLLDQLTDIAGNYVTLRTKVKPLLCLTTVF